MIGAYGVTATTAPFGGAAKPTLELAEPLRGADVVLFADRDATEAGGLRTGARHSTALRDP